MVNNNNEHMNLVPISPLLKLDWERDSAGTGTGNELSNIDKLHNSDTAKK